jgi:hypothetical protein
VINTPGLRLALAGGIVVVVSLIALAFLPDTIPAAAMMIGGLAVIGGFVWSLAHFYTTPGAE